ncbi:MAG: adenosylcobinamide amidohydrolase [Nitrospira sp.]|nr:adenosylcobinamide amidohydrolase [Nitrospira sp.]
MKTEIRSRVRSRHQVIGHTLVINLGGRRRVLSSAPQGGGFRYASHIINHHVDANLSMNGHFPDPARYLRKLASQLCIGDCTVGLMTAVPMTQLATSRVSIGGLWVECFATVGVTNAVRAGEWPLYPAHQRETTSTRVGTINLILITNGSLSTSALVGAVQVATETKTGVLRDHAVLSCKGKDLATGTGTDAVVIACHLRGEGPLHTYSGTHTIMGALIGRSVADCVSRGLAKARK